jgi:hypothetical protein
VLQAAVWFLSKPARPQVTWCLTVPCVLSATVSRKLSAAARASLAVTEPCPATLAMNIPEKQFACSSARRVSSSFSGESLPNFSPLS